ncbi:MAG TPA: hypothetical protein VFU81_00605 [Thermomicrobiales bacterium]|nr:hypothetical protein [Thermomicrobiales bacterium]
MLTRPGPNGEPEPAAVVERGRRAQVERIEERWRVEDEWWRERPISRRYYRLVLAGGRILTVFHDQSDDAWHAQSY